MNNELLQSLEYIEKEKNIKKEVLIETLKSALLSACKKTFRNYEKYSIDIDPQTAEIKIFEEG